jgi:hypothetical protein
MERDLNPPEDKVVFEPDVDSINDEIWLRKKEEEDKCFERGEEK